MDLNKIKDLKNFYKVTVNDIIYSLFCESIKKVHCEVTGDKDISNKNITSVFAYGIPSKKNNTTLYNGLSLTSVPMKFGNDIKSTLEQNKVVLSTLKTSLKA